MAKYEPPATTPGPRGGTLLPPAPSGRPMPPPPGKKPTLKPTMVLQPPKGFEPTVKKKQREDEELTAADIGSAAKKTLPVAGQIALAAPGAAVALVGGATQGPLPEDKIQVDGKTPGLIKWATRIGNVVLPALGVSKTTIGMGQGIVNTFQGDNIKLAEQALKAGESPLPYVLEDVGNAAIVLGGTGLALKGAAAGAKSAGVRAAAEAGAKQAFRAARIADNISDAPITLPVYGIGKGVNYGGRFGRSYANKQRIKADQLEAANPRDPQINVRRIAADKMDDFFGKEVFVDGIARTITRKAMNRFTNRVLRRTNSAYDAVARSVPNIVDQALYRDEINPETGETYGPLTPAENQAVIAVLNGRARLIRELMPRLNKTAGEIADLGRYNYAPGAGLTPEGAELAVKFLNQEVDDVTGQRLAHAAELLSGELEATTQLAREGYGRRNKLQPMYDIPLPEPTRLSQRLRQEGRADMADAIDDLIEQGFFDEILLRERVEAGGFDTPAGRDALMQLQLFLEQAPDSVALDPAIYPPKERNNVAFYGRIRKALEAQAAATAGGTPPGAGYPGGRPTPMDEGPTTGLQPESFYTDINAPGAFSRMPERYLRNSIKQLERLRGRSRQLGEKIVQIEMSIRNLEFKIIKASLRIEALEGYYVDANGNRVIPEEDGTYPADAEYQPGLIEKLIIKRDTARAELERMRAEQAQSTVIDGKVYSTEQVEQLVAEAEQDVATVDAAIAELEAEIEQTTDAMADAEAAQAEAANAFEDLGENADALLEAAATDVDSIPGDPEAFLQVDDGTAALDSARADVEAARRAQTAARNVELEARAKITDLEARYRDEQAKYAAEVAKQEQKAAAGAEAPSREQVLEVLNRLADQGAIPTKIVKAVEKAYDTTFVEPKRGASAKAVDRAVFSSKDGGLGGYRAALVNAVDGNLWYTDSYMAVIIDPTSKFGQKLAETGNQPGVYRTTATGRSAADMQRAQMSGAGEMSPNIQQLVDRARSDAALPPATVIGVDLPATGSVVVLQNADGTVAGVALDNLNKVYEAGDTLHFSDPAKPITVVRNGQIVGIVMPIRGDYTPITPDAVYQKLREGQFGSIGPAAAELDAIQLASATRPRLKPPKQPTITPDDLDAATAEWNDAQEAVRVADQALREAEGQLYAVEQAAPAARLTPPEGATAARRQKHDEDRRRLGELEVAAEAAMAKREDAFAAAAQAKRNNDPNQAELAAAFNAAKAEFDAIDGERSALNGELWLRESREPWLRSNGGPDDPTRAIRPDAGEAPAPRLTPPAVTPAVTDAISQGDTILGAMNAELADAEAARNVPGSGGAAFQRYSLTRIATRDAETALNILREAGADAQTGLTPIDPATTPEALDKRSTENFAARKKWEAAEEKAVALGTEIDVARQEGATEAEVAKLGKKYDAAVQKAQEMKIAWAREELSIAAALYEIDLGGPAARLTPPPVEAEVQAVEPRVEPGLTPPSRYGVELGDVRDIVKRGSIRLSKTLEQIVQAERDVKSATLARRELRKTGATVEELAAAEQRVVANRARVAELKKQRVVVRDEMVAEAIEASNISFLTPFEQTPVDTDGPFGRAYYEGDMQLAIDERRGFIEGLGEYIDKIEAATAEYQKAIRGGAAPNGARASQLRRRIAEADAAFQEQVRKVNDFNYRIGYAATRIADLDGIPRNDAAIALRDNLDARLAAPPPPEVISTSAATEADWQKQSDGTYTINTGSRRYAALKVDVTPPGAKGKRTTWSLKRYGSDGEVIEGSTQVFPNFKAARDYVQKQIDADGLDTGQRYIYRPGRELGPGPSTEVPVNLLAAEQRLQRAEAAVGSAEQRLQNLRTQVEKNTARIEKLRVDEAANRAKLAPITAAAVRTEARLGPEIYTQPDMVQFAVPRRGAPMVGEVLSPEGVPVLPGEGLPAMLRPISSSVRKFDEQTQAVYNQQAAEGVPVEQRPREVEVVEKSVNEALLRRRNQLPPTLPARVALDATRQIGDPFIGSQYVPVGRKVGQARGARRTVEQGLTGDILLRSEKRRTGKGEEIYDIVELGRVLAAERRQMELNEGFRMLLNSQLAVSPEDLLGAETIREFETEAYDRAWRDVTQDEGWAAYAPGVQNRDAVFDKARREILGELIANEMAKRGFETLPAEGGIDAPVDFTEIDGASKFLPTYAKERVMQKSKIYTNAAIDAYLGATGRLTSAFKNVTLPLSLVWQLGDLVGIIWAAAATGVPPSVMADHMVQMLKENYGGPEATRMDVLRNIFKDPQDRRIGELADMLAASGIQDTGLRIEESRRLRGQDPGAEPQTIPQRLLNRLTPDLPRPTLAGGRLGVTTGNVGNLFPSFRKGAYRVNEAINRVGRHAYFLAKLGEELNKLNARQGTNYTLDDIAEMNLHQRPGPIRDAWEDAIDTANEVMGDWLDLTPFERKYVLPHLTFWAWTKHIHKLFAKLAKENPSAIKWQLYLGSLAYDPESDPLEMYSSYVPTVGGGLAGTNFLNAFGDIVEGPIGSLALQGDASRLFAGTSPMPRILNAAFRGQNLAKDQPISRQYGTGEVTKTGQQKNVPLIKRPGELLGFSIQQFPLGTKVLDLLPSGQIPGTSIQTGPFERYDTGQARFKPMTSKPVPKFGGRLLTAARLLTLPGVPTMSIEKMKDIERRAQQRLRAFETAKKTAEARSD